MSVAQYLMLVRFLKYVVFCVRGALKELRGSI